MCVNHTSMKLTFNKRKSALCSHRTWVPQATSGGSAVLGEEPTEAQPPAGLSPPHAHAEALTPWPQCDYTCRSGCQRGGPYSVSGVLRRKDQALTEGQPHEGRGRRWLSAAKRADLRKNQAWQHLNLDFQPPELGQ